MQDSVAWMEQFIYREVARHHAACEWEILRAAEHGQRIARLDQHMDYNGMLVGTELVTLDGLVWARVPGFALPPFA